MRTALCAFLAVYWGRDIPSSKKNLSLVGDNSSILQNIIIFEIRPIN